MKRNLSIHPQNPPCLSSILFLLFLLSDQTISLPVQSSFIHFEALSPDTDVFKSALIPPDCLQEDSEKSLKLVLTVSPEEDENNSALTRQTEREEEEEEVKRRL